MSGLSALPSSKVTPCTPQAEERLRVVPTGIVWGRTVASTCLAAPMGLTSKDMLGVAAIVVEGARGELSEFLLVVGVLGPETSEGPMPASFVELPLVWASQKESVRFALQPSPTDQAKTFELFIGRSGRDEATCRWYQATRFAALDAIWLTPLEDRVPEAVSTSPCDAPPPFDTFRPTADGERPAWPSPTPTTFAAETTRGG